MCVGALKVTERVPPAGVEQRAASKAAASTAAGGPPPPKQQKLDFLQNKWGREEEVGRWYVVEEMLPSTRLTRPHLVP